MKCKSLNPADRMGVYKCIEDVPQRYRLGEYADQYASRDVWQEFCGEYEYQQGSHNDYKTEVDRAGENWKEFMAEREAHHALAAPNDVETWSSGLLDVFQPRHAHRYWRRIRRFYDWLQWHTEHPHVYTPVLMAAAEGGGAGEIWEVYVQRTRKRRQRYE